MNTKNRLYILGLVITLLGAAEIVQAVKGEGSMFIAACIFAVGFGCILGGYVQ